MNTDSIEAVLFTRGDDAVKHGPGAIVWSDDEECLYMIMPGHKHLDAIEVTRDPAKQAARVWLLTGTRDKPSLTPSLLSRGVWHGYLTDGRFVSC